MEICMIRWRRESFVLAIALGVLLSVGAQAQKRSEQPAADSAQGQQYKFSLAPAENAAGATADVLLTARPQGGYAAEMTSASLPDPSGLKQGASAFVVWLYDPATQKKQRVAALSAQNGSAAFDVTWPKFALVVTAEPSPEPKQWSGVAVLTGQPDLPENPGEPGLAESPAEDAQAETPSAGEMAAADQDSAAVTSEATAGMAQPDSAAGAQASAPGAGAEPPAPGAGASAGMAPDTGVGVQVTGSPPCPPGAPQVVTAEAPPAPDDESSKGKKKKRFSNSALDAMAAAARGEEPTPQAPAVDPCTQPGGVQPAQPAPAQPADSAAPAAGAGTAGATTEAPAGAASAAGASSATSGGPARIELDGTGKASDASAKIEVSSGGTLQLSAKKLPDPGQLGGEWNTFVLWTVDPATGRATALGPLQSDGSGNWSLTGSGAQPGSALMVTAESGPQPGSRSGPVVLTGRWENE